MNREVMITTIVAVIVAILDLLKVFFGIDFGVGDEQVLAFVTLAVGAVCYWRNQDWTKISAKHTGAARLEKKQRKGKITGENFFDDVDEDMNDYDDESEV